LRLQRAEIKGNVAIKAIFVGINKHLDPTIPELSGARRDATALWALFTDTIEYLAARLLVDERATAAEVCEAILGTLAGAQPDDVIVLSFAGHGSPDGNLVLFDTDPANLAGTGLSMTALADAFKATRARAVLCILDCASAARPPHVCLKPSHAHAAHLRSRALREKGESCSLPVQRMNPPGNSPAPVTAC
jgi:hypothetical protein